MRKPENTFEANRDNRHVHVVRYLEGHMDDLWRYFSEYQSLGEWVAPAPNTIVTKKMLFEPAGYWLYGISDPAGNTQWCKTEYIDIDPMHSIETMESFCDENGKIDRSLPVTKWSNNFEDIDGKSARLNLAIDFESKEDVDKYIDMDFEGRINTCLDQLASILSHKMRNP